MGQADPILTRLGAGPAVKKLVETALALSNSQDPQQRNHAYSFMESAIKELEDEDGRGNLADRGLGPDVDDGSSAHKLHEEDEDERRERRMHEEEDEDKHRDRKLHEEEDDKPRERKMHEEEEDDDKRKRMHEEKDEKDDHKLHEEELANHNQEYHKKQTCNSLWCPYGVVFASLANPYLQNHHNHILNYYELIITQFQYLSLFFLF